jgi:hypothetical protein
VTCGELVEQLALQAHARERGIVALDLLADLRFQVGDVLGAHAFGERVGELGRCCLLQLLHGHREDGFLAGEILGRVLGRERDLHLALLARGSADELILEAGDEAAAAEAQVMPLGAAARERHAVDRAGEVDDRDIALLRLAAGIGGLEVGIAFAQARQRCVQVAVVDVDLDALQRQLAEIHRLDIGQRLDREAELEILALLELADFEQLRLQRGAQALVGERFARGLGHRLLDDLARERVAVALSEQRGRNLAWAEARQADVLRELGELVRILGREIVRGDHDLVFALQAF